MRNPGELEVEQGTRAPDGLSDQEFVQARGVMRTPTVLVDGIRFAFDMLAHGAAFAAAGGAFLGLWGLGPGWPRVLAFPVAFLALVVAFDSLVVLLGLLLVRRVEPGTYSLTSRRVLRWIIADSFIHFVERSCLRGYLKGFAPGRSLLYRVLGARIAPGLVVGADVRILDPWCLEVGAAALIGSFAVISGHSVEGGQVHIAPVRIGERAVVGMRAVLLPGVEVGDGAVVGAGALVTKGTVIPAGEVWAGVPARKIGEMHRPAH